MREVERTGGPGRYSAHAQSDAWRCGAAGSLRLTGRVFQRSAPAASVVVAISSEDQATTFWCRNRIAKFLGSVDPKPDSVLSAGQCRFLGCTVRCTAWQFGYLGYESVVFVAPVNDDFVFVHSI